MLDVVDAASVLLGNSIGLHSVGSCWAIAATVEEDDGTEICVMANMSGPSKTAKSIDLECCLRGGDAESDDSDPDDANCDGGVDGYGCHGCCCAKRVGNSG